MTRNARSGTGSARWAAVFGLVVLLLFITIVIAPWAMTQWAESRFTRTLGAPVHLERITLNPFTATARFSGLDIGEPRAPMIAVPDGEVTFAWSTLWQSGIQVRQVRLEAPRLHLVSRADGSLNVVTLGSEGAASDGSSGGTGSSGSVSSQADSEASPLTIARLEVQGGRIDWQDRRTPENASLRASDVGVTLHDYRLGSGRPMQGQATATLGGGAVDLEGAFGIQPFTGDLAVTTQQVAVAPLDPWLTAAVPARIDAGRFDLDGRLRFGAASEALIAYSGQVALTDLETHTPQDQPLFSLTQGRFEDVDFALGQELRVASATLTGPRLTAQLDDAGQFNLAEALGRGQDDAPRAGGDDTDSGGAEADSGGDNGADENDGRGREGQGGGMSVALDHLGIEQGEFDFEDRRMSPTVALDIEKLEGELNGLDTRSNAPVSYRFDGMESDATPVMIEGEVSFGESLEARWRLTTERLALSEFAPYIRRFAGYRIDSGSADLDLNYQLRDGALTARNHIILKQLDLGEQTDRDETSLPLKKLVGLLQAESGVIDLDIPIETTVDGDTQVDMSVVIWQAISESLGNLLTSPIDSLQALIGGESGTENEQGNARKHDEG